MSEQISFQDADGKRVSGLFDVSHGMITVTAPDGRTKTAEIEEGMLSPETLARMLLLQLHHEGYRPKNKRRRRRPPAIATQRKAPARANEAFQRSN